MTDFDDDQPIGDLRKRFESQLAEMKKANEESSKAAKEASSRAEKAERQLAFAQAGIDLSDKRAQLFVKGYDGELEAEKVKSAWTEYFGAPQQPAPPQQQSQPQAAVPGQVQGGGIPFSEISAGQQIDAALSGAPIPEGQGTNLLQGMRQLFEQGAEPEEVAMFLGAHGYPVAKGFD